MPHTEPLTGRHEPGEGQETNVPDAPSRPLDWARYFVDRLIAHEKAFDGMEKSFIAFRGRVTTILGIAGAIVGIAGWGIISAAWALQRDLGRMEANLAGVTASMDRLEKSNEKLGDKIDRLSEIINRMQGRLERDAAPAAKGAGVRPSKRTSPVLEADVAGPRPDMMEFQGDVRGQLDRIEEALASHRPETRLQ